MQDLILPHTAMADFIFRTKLPLGIVFVDSEPGQHVELGSIKKAHSDPTPAGFRTVILPLYYANAYPGCYYQHPVQTDVAPRLNTAPQA